MPSIAIGDRAAVWDPLTVVQIPPCTKAFGRREEIVVGQPQVTDSLVFGSVGAKELDGLGAMGVIVGELAGSGNSTTAAMPRGNVARSAGLE